MAKRFTQVKLDAFKEIQVETGVIVTYFNPANPVLDRSKILCTTSGGVTVTCKPSFIDYFEDVDNVPNGTMEGKQIDSYECSISGSSLDFNKARIKMQIGAADIDVTDDTRITPRNELKIADFVPSIWWVGDMADGGFVACQLLNVLSTDGLSMKSGKKSKNTTAFTFMGHYSINAVDTVPMNFYIVSGEDEGDSIILDKYSLSVPAGNSATITATTVPGTATVSWQSLNTDVATVAAGVVTGVAEGTTQILAKFIDDDVTYVAICTVTVTAAGEG